MPKPLKRTKTENLFPLIQLPRKSEAEIKAVLDAAGIE